MKKYLVLITISLALMVTTILAGLVFRPMTSLNTNSQNPASREEDGTALFSAISYTPDTPATFSTMGQVSGPMIYLNLPAEVDTNIEYTLVSASVAPDFIGIQPSICTHSDTSISSYSTLQEQAALSYWQQVTTWLTPAEYQVTLWQTNDALNDYILVSSDADQWHGNCPTLIDEDV